MYKLVTLVVLITVSQTYGESGLCSWYDTHPGDVIENGEVFSQNTFTAGHKSLRIGSIVRVMCNGKIDMVIINRRLVIGGSILTMDRAAAEFFGIIDSKLCQCTVTSV
ncbi:unnamed protein product [Oppiella nova]|uniref:Uncharacterized protein n=1 Tax=Oppiella nova TaxID=334625 RepID=A0A7R9MB18_9ACAR|nr:unnamed protein product [Oppiella nova]CAG2173565.1 unnamed protein product [Oppiella nova]